MDTFPQTPEQARLCIHANKVWFGHECGLCEETGKYVWQDEVGPSRWIYIERDAYPYRDHDKNVYIGPFTGPTADEDAGICMENALLVDHLLQREGGGGTDCYVTTDQPDNERDDVYIIDPEDPNHTGKPPGVTGIEAVNLAIFGLNTYVHPDASASEDMDTLEDKIEGVIKTLGDLREWLIANPEWEENR